MNNITLELVMPVPELKPELISELFSTLGATTAPAVAIADVQYGKGARQVPIVRMKEELYTWSWESTSNKLTVKPYTKHDSDWIAEQSAVIIRGFQTGDTILFKTEEDAKEWLLKLSSIEQLKLTVQTHIYKGTAVMYLSEEYSKVKDKDGDQK